MPIALLTGGTGFVGGHVARALGAQGWKLRLLARTAPRAGEGLLAGVEFETVAGSLSSGGIPAVALAGVDAIVHVAGLTKARSLDDYREVNVRGTERLLAAAGEACPAARFVLVSSLAAAGPAREGRPLSEADPARPISWYGSSKREAEQAVARTWKGSWLVLRPGVIYGPGDRGLFDYFRMAAFGWVPVPAGRTRIQILGADQAALAIARAAGKPELSARTGFLCDPEPVTVGELARIIAGLPKRRARLIPVPAAAVRLLGMVETAREGLTGRSRPFNADKAREVLAGDWLCDAGPIRKALDLPEPLPLAEGLAATWRWYRASGWLPGSAL